MIQNPKAGFLFSVLSSIAFGLMGTFIHLSVKEIPFTEVAFIRSFANALILTPFIFKSIGSLISKKAIPLHLRSLFGTLSILCYFWNLKYANVGTAISISYVAQIFVVILSWLFLKERTTKSEGIGISIIILGATLLYLPQNSNVSSQVFTIGILGGFFASIAYVTLRKASETFSPSLIVWSFSIFSTCFCPLFPDQPWVAPTSYTLLIYLFVVAISGLAAQIFMTKSFFYLKAPIATALASMTIFSGMFTQMIFDHMTPTLTEMSCYLLVIFGIVVLQIKNFNLEKRISI